MSAARFFIKYLPSGSDGSRVIDIGFFGLRPRLSKIKVETVTIIWLHILNSSRWKLIGALDLWAKDHILRCTAHQDVHHTINYWWLNSTCMKAVFDFGLKTLLLLRQYFTLPHTFQADPSGMVGIRPNSDLIPSKKIQTQNLNHS